MKELIIDAKRENLDAVLDFINAELENSGCTFELMTAIDVAVEEIFVNIAHYAYNPEVGGAIIRVSAGSEIVIEFEDNGVPYNPLERSDPDVTAESDERDIGGLGIYLVKSIMDAVEYHHEDSKNLLVIKKVNTP